MSEPNKSYVSYLNSLNSYNAKNKNAYSEKNIETDFYRDTVVDIGISQYIAEKIKSENPQVIILSGQAGDGKTSIMYQVAKYLNPDFKIQSNQNIFDISAGNIECRFIKDFSELSDTEKTEKLKEILNLSSQNKFAFVVANTGPLINTFGKLFSDEEAEKAKMDLIESIRTSNGKEKNIYGYSISVINMASIDNSYFAPKFLERILNEKLWSACALCEKKDFCPILRNRNLIMQNPECVKKFMENHYIWLSEHGTRLTVRSITEQISFMITGGKSCSQIRNVYNYDLLFPNLFFGFVGSQKDAKALRLAAVKEASKNEYYLKKMRIDETLIVKSDYENLFSEAWVKILKDIEKRIELKRDFENERNLFYSFLRRAYIFQNNSDSEQQEKDMQDIFSNNFASYLKYRKSSSRIPGSFKKPLFDALSMIYTGRRQSEDSNKIPITLNKKSGILQSVQFVIGYLNNDDFDIVKEKSNDGALNKTEDIYHFYPEINGTKLNIRLTLPLFDYFSSLQKGIIETDVDPVLSHGIESLKAQITEIISKKKRNDDFELSVLRSKGTKSKKLEIADGKIFII